VEDKEVTEEATTWVLGPYPEEGFQIHLTAWSRHLLQQYPDADEMRPYALNLENLLEWAREAVQASQRGQSTPDFPHSSILPLLLPVAATGTPSTGNTICQLSLCIV
jgi:hypothetical protein